MAGMKIKLFLAWVCLIGCWHASAGQDLHFFFVTPQSEPAWRGDLHNLMQQAAGAADLQLKWHDLSRVRTAEKLKAELRRVRGNDRDVFWFYYFGPSAYNNDDLLEDFPYFELGGEQLFLTKIHHLLLASPHRLVVTMLDGANDRSGLIGRLEARADLNADRMGKLLRAQGDLLITGYSRYQSSSYHPAHGGVYSTAFFQALQYVSSTACAYAPIWAEVLYFADHYLERMLKGLRKEQKSFVRLNVQGHDFPDGLPPHGFDFQGERGPTYEYALPQFPLPPPRPSARLSLPRPYFGGSGTLGDVNRILHKAITSCGYYEKSYYAVPDGFALATIMEQMDPNTAAPLPPPDRWEADVSGLEDFNLVKYLEALIFGKTGSFRVFVFVVTPVAFSTTGATVSQEEAREWLSTGMNKLPRSLRELPFTEEHQCTVLIYEFEQRDHGEARFVERSRFPSRVHLERAHILDYLVKP